MANKLTHQEADNQIRAALEESERQQRASAMGGREALMAYLSKGQRPEVPQLKPGQLLFGGEAAGMPGMASENAPGGMGAPEGMMNA